MKEKGLGRGRLRGKRLFLSASVPTAKRPQFYGGESAHRQIEDAVISLSRAVFAQGGALVFGGHPAISPLVAMVAGEYLAPFPPGDGEQPREQYPPPIEIYQSRAFEGFLPNETLMMYRLGYAHLHWTEAVEGERFDRATLGDKPPCPKSVDAMRRQMIEEMQPVAMVAIGGMEGILDESRIFRELRKGAPIYTLASTGGAAAHLIGRHPEVRAIDQEILDQLKGRGPMKSVVSRETSGEDRTDRPVIPYALIVQALVQELI